MMVAWAPVMRAICFYLSGCELALLSQTPHEKEQTLTHNLAVRKDERGNQQRWTELNAFLEAYMTISLLFVYKIPQGFI